MASKERRQAIVYKVEDIWVRLLWVVMKRQQKGGHAKGFSQNLKRNINQGGDITTILMP